MGFDVSVNGCSLVSVLQGFHERLAAIEQANSLPTPAGALGVLSKPGSRGGSRGGSRKRLDRKGSIVAAAGGMDLHDAMRTAAAANVESGNNGDTDTEDEFIPGIDEAGEDNANNTDGAAGSGGPSVPKLNITGAAALGPPQEPAALPTPEPPTPKVARVEPRRLPSFSACEDDGEKFALLHAEVQMMAELIAQNVEDDQKAILIQKSKDRAQDKLLKMELEKLQREIDSRMSRRDVMKLRQHLESNVDKVADRLQELLLDKAHGLSDSLSDEVALLLERLGVIQNAAEEQGRMTDAALKSMKGDLAQAVQASARADKTVAKLAQQLADALAREKESASATKGLVKAQNEFHLRISKTEADLETTVGTEVAQLKSSIERLVTTELKAAREGLKEQELALTTLERTFERDLRTTTEVLGQTLRAEQTRQLGKMEATVAASEQSVKSLVDDGVSEQIKSHAAHIETIVEDVKALEATRGEVRLLTHNSELHAAGLEQLKSSLGRVQARVDGELRVDVDATKAALAEFKQSHLKDFNVQVARTSAEAAELGGALRSMRAELGEAADAAFASSERMDGVKVEVLEYVEKVSTASKHAALKLLEGYSKTKLDVNSSLQEIAEALQVQGEGHSESVERVERSNIALAGMYRQMDGTVKNLASRDAFWEKIEAELGASAVKLAKHCNELEAEAVSKRTFSLPYDSQKFIAGSTQKLAETFATKADFDVIRQMVVHTNPLEDDSWDAKVEEARKQFVRKFIDDVSASAKKAHPDYDPLVTETRAKFLDKMQMAVRVAMSKFQPIQVGATLFGKRKIGPTCLACDRPFNKGGASQAGDARALIQPNAYPPSAAHADALNDDGSVGPVLEPGDRVDVPVFGARQASRHVFRSGFKMTRQVATPLARSESLSGLVSSSIGRPATVGVAASPKKQMESVKVPAPTPTSSVESHAQVWSEAIALPKLAESPSKRRMR